MKKLILLFVTMFALLVMTACGTADTDENANGAERGNGSSEVVENNDDEAAEEAAEETETDTEGKEEAVEEEQKAVEDDLEMIQDTGAYVGLQDNNSIEVNTESHGTIALRISEVDYDFNSLKENTHVAIKYYENEHGQNILKSIEVQ